MMSVVIPVFNGAEVVETTVPALLALRGVDEWVWVDDGSTDGTGHQLEELIGQETRARVIRHAINRGRSAARNTGTEATRGDWILFFDADVAPQPDAALRLVEAAGAPGAVAAVAGIESVLDAPGDPYQEYLRRYPRGPGAVRSGPVEWRFFLAGACTVRRESLVAAGRFDERIAYGEDFALACRLSGRHPGGLRLADTTVTVHGVGTLDSALANVRAFGEALFRIQQTCPSALDLAGIPKAARGPACAVAARLASLAPALTRSVRGLPAAVQPRAVRYLLGLALITGYHRARTAFP